MTWMNPRHTFRNASQEVEVSVPVPTPWTVSTQGCGLDASSYWLRCPRNWPGTP